MSVNISLTAEFPLGRSPGNLNDVVALVESFVSDWLDGRLIFSTMFVMPARPFSPGFRISGFDAVILIVGAVGSYMASAHSQSLALITGYVVGHFFLFCNVFRISRRPELVWAATFTALTACTRITGMPGWTATIACSLLLTLLLITREMKKPYYHGIGWSKIQPDLRAWWGANG